MWAVLPVFDPLEMLFILRFRKHAAISDNTLLFEREQTSNLQVFNWAQNIGRTITQILLNQVRELEKKIKSTREPQS